MPLQRWKKKLQRHATFAGAAEGAVGAAFTDSSSSALQDAIGPETEGARSNGAVISPLVTLMLPISFQENEWFVFTVPDLSCPKKFCATVCKAPTAAGASTQQRHRQHARGDKVKVRGDNAGRDN